MSGGLHLGKGSLVPKLPDDGKLCLFSMRFCPFAHRVHLVLNAKQVPYHTVFINLSEKPDWLTEINPLGKVPALQLEKGMAPLVESLIIAEYLDEAYDVCKLFPKDPLKKAQDKIFIERFGAVAGAMYKICFSGDTNVEESLCSLLNGLDVYEKELSERGSLYFDGDKAGILDYMIWPWFERFESFQHLLPEGFEYDGERFKHLIKWRSLMIEDPIVQTHYLDGETHAKYMRSYRNSKPDYNMLVQT